MFRTRWHRVPQLNNVWAHKHACIHMLGKDKFDHSFICTCINTNTVKGQKCQDSIKQVNWHFRRDLLSLLIYLMKVEFAKERRTKTEKSNSIFFLPKLNLLKWKEEPEKKTINFLWSCESCICIKGNNNCLESTMVEIKTKF